MNKKIFNIAMLIICSIILVSCGKQEEPQDITYININGKNISLEFTENELVEILNDQALIAEDYFSKGLSCSDITMKRRLRNKLETNLVFGQNALVTYMLDFSDTLQEIWIAWPREYDEQMILSQIYEIYGNEYCEDWIDFVGIIKVLRWDLNDGISILFIPEESMGGEGAGLGMLITHTEDIEDVEPME